MHDVDESTFHKLCLQHGRRDSKQRLIGKNNGAFGHRVHVPRKAEGLEGIHQLITEFSAAP